MNMNHKRFHDLLQKVNLSTNIKFKNNIYYVDTEVEFYPKKRIVKILGKTNKLILDRPMGIDQGLMLLTTIQYRMGILKKG